MANTSLTNTACDHTSTAGFRAWGLELHNQLASVGLTNTADTGQVNWATVTVPGINTAGGYEIWRFNDTLQGTTPIFLKIEFGTGGTSTYPAVWITVGNGSNGSGTLTGLTSSRCACGYYQAPLSTTTLYYSRVVYNPTLGFFGFAWKLGLSMASGAPYNAAFVFRSCDTTGAATSACVNLLTNDNTATATGKYGVMQCLSYVNTAIYPPVIATQGQWWATHAYSQNPTQTGDNIAVDPVYYLSPSLGITQCLARSLVSEIPLHLMANVALVGSTPHNYVSIGAPFTTTSGNAWTGVDANYMGLSLNLLMLWE